MFIVVFGPSGSGKTTLGRALAEALGWPFFEGDDFHPRENVERMRAGMALGDAERAPWLAALARLIAGHVEGGTPGVLACSALKRRYRAVLVPPATPPGSVRFVYLHADRALLAERLAKRRGHFFPPQLLDSQIADLERPSDEEPAPVLQVDVSRPVEEVVERIRAAFGLSDAARPPPPGPRSEPRSAR